jgi:hypothetical protein
VRPSATCLMSSVSASAVVMLPTAPGSVDSSSAACKRSAVDPPCLPAVFSRSVPFGTDRYSAASGLLNNRFATLVPPIHVVYTLVTSLFQTENRYTKTA